MYRLVIVDDEAYILRQMKTLFQWEQMGFQVAGTFPSGEECLAYARMHPVDVLLTDIRLNEMSGLQLIAAMREMNPSVETVLISAYSEFEYAREALGLGVAEYLLKPICFDDIHRCFKRLRMRMDARADMEAEFAALQRAKLYSDILYGIVASPAETAIPIPDGMSYSLLSMELSDPLFPRRCRQMLEDASAQVGAEFVLLPEIRPGALTALLIFDLSAAKFDPEGFVAQCRALLPPVKTAYATKLYSDVFVLATEYRSVMMRSFEERGMLHQLRTYFNSGEPESAGKLLSTYLKCRKFDLNQAIAFSEGLLEGDVERLYCAQNLDEVVREVCRACDSRLPAETPEERIANAQRYIEENLANDISLESAAQYCSLTPSYFSRLFKQVTGERFIAYLVHARIERAKALLEDESMKIDDIPNLVGYYSRSYFYKIFTAETGMTLAEYRRNACKERP